jgi:hypothetical protein
VSPSNRGKTKKEKDMPRHRENQFKGRSQSVEHVKAGKGSSGVFKPKKKGYSSSEDGVRGTSKHGPPRATGWDSRSKIHADREDEYSSSPSPTRRTKYRPPPWGGSEPNHDSSAGYGPAMENTPRKERYVPHKGVPANKDDFSRLVEAPALIKGLQNGRAEITGILQEFANMATADYSIKEIELSVSFSASGKFLGFGVGGATSVKIKIAPTNKG